jgi:SAM-dependent methyltransferase
MLVCDEPERRRRLAAREKPASHWDVLAEHAAEHMLCAYDRFPALPVDTTGLTPKRRLGQSSPSRRKDPADMRTSSLWEHTLSFFPQYLASLKEHTSPDATVAVVGASDGKFVVPLAAAGYRVIAIERDPLALHGGEIRLPGDISTRATGLIARLKAEDLHHQVEVTERDFLAEGPCCDPCDAVWTSCSWHYSMNHHRPLAEFIARMRQLVRPGGVFGGSPTPRRSTAPPRSKPKSPTCPLWPTSSATLA